MDGDTEKGDYICPENNVKKTCVTEGKTIRWTHMKLPPTKFWAMFEEFSNSDFDNEDSDSASDVDHDVAEVEMADEQMQIGSRETDDSETMDIHRVDVGAVQECVMCNCVACKIVTYSLVQIQQLGILIMQLQLFRVLLEHQAQLSQHQTIL